MNKIFWTMAGLTLVFTACSSKPVVMTEKDVEISRAAAKSDCKSLGTIRGTTMSVKGTIEDAIEDMKKEASRKGANYVQMQSTGANTNSVTGVAYDCP